MGGTTREGIALDTHEHKVVAFRAHGSDTVATMLEDAAPGLVFVIDSDGGPMSDIAAVEPIARGHKIALVSMDSGANVIKYGVVIGTASRQIAAGAWVHLHNCASGFDARSSTLDVVTGAPSDTQYG